MNPAIAPATDLPRIRTAPASPATTTRLILLAIASAAVCLAFGTGCATGNGHRPPIHDPAERARNLPSRPSTEPARPDQPPDSAGHDRPRASADAAPRSRTPSAAERHPAATEDDAQRWIWVVSAADRDQGAWITGDARPGNRIVIETHNVHSFTIALDRLPVDWTRRVILKIDGSASELTRRHYPRLRLTRSPSGGWVSTEDKR